MLDQARHRPMTFTGCWTCKARKVRCDERPGSCRNCTKRGIDCGGYGIKLHWVSDHPADRSARPPNSQGRRRISLDRIIGQRYRIEVIDDFLLAIDNDAASGLLSRRGPFSTFPASSEIQEEAKSTTETSSETSFVATTSLSQSLDVQHDDCLTVPALPDDSLAMAGPRAKRSTIDFSCALQPPTKQHDLFSDSAANIHKTNCNGGSHLLALDCRVAEHSTAPTTVFDQDYSHTTSLLLARDNSTKDMIMNITQRIIPTTNQSSRLPIQHIRSSLFGDQEVDNLMHHYQMHMAYLLQPVFHPQNPYHGLYIPIAIEGALAFQSDPIGSRTNIQSALYHAVLAKSAFHLWYCDKSQMKYQTLGIEHKSHALRYLQATINSSNPVPDHRLLLMVMLSLLSTGILSGEGDFMMHLKGTIQLRSLRRRWRVISGRTRQLNEISAFLALLARTTNFQPLLTPGTIQEDDSTSLGENNIIQSSVSFEYMYGVPPAIAAAIEETCRLSELLGYYDGSPGRPPIPEELLQACETLGERLLLWSSETEKPVTIVPTGEMMTIFSHHANAWHYAALIYYYRRIQRYDSRDLVKEVEHVVKCMDAVEDTKAKSKSDSTNRMAPITWPMFIASCDAIGPGRDSCRRWWERVERYGIANIGKQWDVVQQIWKKRDEIQQICAVSTSWIDIFGSLGIQLLPV